MENEINKEEVLTEDELEQVAGGTRGELSCDTKFLNALGVMDITHEPGYCQNHMTDVRKEINSYLQDNSNLTGFKVSAVSVNGENTYRIHGKKVPRSKFYHDICQALGKSNFDYKQYL